MSEQQWAREAPTEPGWYWLWLPDVKDMPFAVRVFDERGALVFRYLSPMLHHVKGFLRDDAWWLPIEHPQPPQEQSNGE